MTSSKAVTSILRVGLCRPKGWLMGMPSSAPQAGGKRSKRKEWVVPLMIIFAEDQFMSGEGNGTHSSSLAWKIPWTEKPGRLQLMGLRRVGHDWVTSISLFSFGEGNGNPLQCSCLENPRDGGIWWASVYGVAQSRTQLKRLSSSSSLCQAPTSNGLPWWLSW